MYRNELVSTLQPKKLRESVMSTFKYTDQVKTNLNDMAKVCKKHILNSRFKVVEMEKEKVKLKIKDIPMVRTDFY